MCSDRVEWVWKYRKVSQQRCTQSKGNGSVVWWWDDVGVRAVVVSILELTSGLVLLPAVFVQPSVLPIQQQQQPQTSSWQPDAPKDPQTLLQEAENIRQLLLRNR